VQFDKTQLLDLLKSQGQHDQAAAADGQLPQTVDTDQHAGLLNSLGLDPMELITKLGGGGGGGALGGLGGMLGR
jgi:hypothetical protein